jgi:ribosomal protein L37AE/L43A
LDSGEDMRANLARIKRGETEEWLLESEQKYKCPACRKPLSVYETKGKCHHCGADLSSKNRKG